MANTAAASTPTPEIPALVQAARDFLKSLKDETIPPGSVRDVMDDKYHKTKGLSIVLKALGEFIDLKQEMVAVDANRALVARLKGEDGIDLASMIVDIATNPDDLAVRREALRKALTIGNDSIFDRIKLAVGNIARDKGIQMEDNLDQAGGEDDPRRRKRGPSNESKDKGTWRESIHDVDKPKVSDDEIRRAANENDKAGGNVDDKAIRESAQGGPKDFTPGDDHKTEYEKAEDRPDTGYFQDQADEYQEIRAYAKMAQKLTREYRRIMEAPVAGRGGMARPGGE